MKKFIFTLALVLFAVPVLADEPTHTITCFLLGGVSEPYIAKDVYKFTWSEAGIFRLQTTPNGNVNDLIVGVDTCLLEKKETPKHQDIGID